MSLYILRKLRERRIWRRLWYERLSEPLQLNVASLFVALFGSFRAKVAYDLVAKQPYAFGLLAAADMARQAGLRAVSVAEFGVARGEGLMNLQALAERVTRETGVEIRIYGFDTGEGMPPPTDYRDHPRVYKQGDFPMDAKLLEPHLGPNTRLVLGDIAETIGPFLESLSPDAPLGFVSCDLDFYSSTRDALQIFEGPADRYLPTPFVYFDDIIYDFHNSWCGELGAIEQFNRKHEHRKLEAPRFFEHGRLFRRVPWVRQIYLCYLFDGEWWNTPGGASRVLDNTYLDKK